MAYSEDHIALAAEYALGTLDADERAQVDAMMIVDKEYAAVVQAWELRLGALNQMVGSVEPRPIVWEGVRAAIGQADPQTPLILPDAPPVVSPEQTQEVTGPAPPAVDTNVIRLSKRASRWRGFATGMSAMAAALVAIISLQVYRPELLPDSLRPKPRTEIVEVKTPSAPVPSAQYVALLQKDGSSPAFILTVDAATKTFTVRRVGAESEPGKDYELWLVSDKLPRPRSLGVIGGKEFTTNPALASYDPDLVSNATYAVTIEPEGGSPTGVATGPIVFTGKLVETVPPAEQTAPQQK